MLSNVRKLKDQVRLFAIALSITSLFAVSPSPAQEPRNLSIEDMIAGFESNALWYYELLLLNGKYSRAFNQCLQSKPADYDWIRFNCRKQDAFKNAFQCAGDAGLVHVWFVYESREQCDLIRKQMKERMDALRE